MHDLSLSSLEAKAVLQNLESAVQGTDVEVRSPFPGLPSACLVRVLEAEPKKWLVQLIALGVPVAKVLIEVKSNMLSMGVQK